MRHLEYFLDTSFLLPFFSIGIDVENFERDFEKILLSSDITFGFSSISLVEIRFLVEKSIRKGYGDELRDDYIIGLKSIQNSKRFHRVDFLEGPIPQIEVELFERYNHRDYFDRVIMASALHTSKYLITMDRSFFTILKDLENDQFHGAISWEQLVKTIKL